MGGKGEGVFAQAVPALTGLVEHCGVVGGEVCGVQGRDGVAAGEGALGGVVHPVGVIASGG
jgi:hypothetical protein